MQTKSIPKKLKNKFHKLETSLKCLINTLLKRYKNQQLQLRKTSIIKVLYKVLRKSQQIKI